jgi:exosortase
MLEMPFSVAIFWLALCWTLSAHWSTNAQYSFGWLVPPLALVLGWKRWHSRPEPGLPASGAKAAMTLLVVLFMPIWFVAQPNPEWRLLGWALGLAACAFALCGFGAAGGKAWAWHFAFPVAFTLAAVPWPSAVEQPVVQGLMRLVAGLSADLLNAAGIAAAAEGAVIQLKAGTLGVDEACSGVRSLQASLMVALFLGELYRLSAGRRFVLFAIGGVVAFCCNVGRAVFLASRVAAQGIDAIARYHDPAGFTILTICFALVWGAALLVARNQKAPASPDAPGPAHGWPRAWGWGLTGWLLVTIAGAEWWFRQAPRAAEPAWTFVFPEKLPGFRTLELPRETQAQLQADAAKMGAWSSPAGQWLAFSFRWYAGTGRARILARMHKPDACLPATGWMLIDERPIVELRAGEVRVPFRALTFAKGEDRAHVYFCLWQEHADGRYHALEENVRLASVQSVLRRERGLGQQIVEVVLSGPADAATADEAFRKEIGPLLQERKRDGN